MNPFWWVMMFAICDLIVYFEGMQTKLGRSGEADAEELEEAGVDRSDRSGAVSEDGIFGVISVKVSKCQSAHGNCSRTNGGRFLVSECETWIIIKNNG